MFGVSYRPIRSRLTAVAGWSNRPVNSPGNVLAEPSTLTESRDFIPKPHPLSTAK